MISTPETLELICQLVLSKTGTSLNEAQRLLLGEIWEHPNKTYDQIATDLGYSSNYIKKTIAPQLWKLLSSALGEKVQKNNLKAVGEKRLNHLPESAIGLIFQINQRLEPYKSGKVQPSQPIQSHQQISAIQDTSNNILPGNLKDLQTLSCPIYYISPPPNKAVIKKSSIPDR
jgi:hypothetical protein